MPARDDTPRSCRGVGHAPVTTHLFVKGGRYLDSDAVFGVKDSLIVPFKTQTSKTLAAKYGIKAPFATCEYDFVLDDARRPDRCDPMRADSLDVVEPPDFLRSRQRSHNEQTDRKGNHPRCIHPASVDPCGNDVQLRLPRAAARSQIDTTPLLP